MESKTLDRLLKEVNEKIQHQINVAKIRGEALKDSDMLESAEGLIEEVLQDPHYREHIAYEVFSAFETGFYEIPRDED